MSSRRPSAQEYVNVARVSARRPLPAIVFFLGLTLLTALVWWRVISRVNADAAKPKAVASCAAPAAATLLPQPTSVTLDVLNSTQRALLAHNASSTFKSLGFQINQVANDTTGAIAGVAQIRYGPQGKLAAQLVSFYLPGATLVPNKRTDAEVEVSLGNKFTAPKSTAYVRQQLKAKHINQVPAAAVTGSPTATPTC